MEHFENSRRLNSSSDKIENIYMISPINSLSKVKVIRESFFNVDNDMKMVLQATKTVCLLTLVCLLNILLV